MRPVLYVGIRPNQHTPNPIRETARLIIESGVLALLVYVIVMLMFSW